MLIFGEWCSHFPRESKIQTLHSKSFSVVEKTLTLDGYFLKQGDQSVLPLIDMLKNGLMRKTESSNMLSQLGVLEHNDPDTRLKPLPQNVS